MQGVSNEVSPSAKLGNIFQTKRLGLTGLLGGEYNACFHGWKTA